MEDVRKNYRLERIDRNPPERDSWPAPGMISPEAALSHLSQILGHALTICDDGQDADYQLIEEASYPPRTWWVKRINPK